MISKRALLLGGLATPFVSRMANATSNMIREYSNLAQYAMPENPLRVNPTHPLTRGMVFCIVMNNPSNVRDIINGITATNVNGFGFGGLNANFSRQTRLDKTSSQYYSLPSITPYNMTGALSFVWAGSAPKGTIASDTVGPIISKSNSATNYLNDPFNWATSATDSQTFRRAGSSDVCAYTGGGSPLSGGAQPFIITRAVTHTGSFAGGEALFYDNGILQSTTTIASGAGPATTASDPMYVGALNLGAADGGLKGYSTKDHAVIYAWNRVLTATEMLLAAREPFGPLWSPQAIVSIGSMRGVAAALQRSRAVIIQ